MRIAKIIATCFSPRTVRLQTSICGSPPGYFSHSQKYENEKDVIELIEMSIELEGKCDAGENVDLIIINNDCGSQSGINYLDKINGKKIRRNKIITIHRENIGRSFGAYNHAYKLFRKSYDYFIFTEDDVLICRNGYAEIPMRMFSSFNNIGLIAYIGLSHSVWGRIERLTHAHGGVGIYDGAALEKIFEKNGSLPYASDISNQKYEQIINLGEVSLSQNIIKEGFQIAEIESELKLYDFAYDLERGIDMGRYLSFPHRIYYNLRNRNFSSKKWR